MTAPLHVCLNYCQTCKAEVERLRAALQFYADPARSALSFAWNNPDPGTRGDALLGSWDLIDDGGQRARDALAGK